MRRTATAGLLPVLVASLLVGDVVSLPDVSRPVSAGIDRVSLDLARGSVLTSASAGLVGRAAAARATASQTAPAVPVPGPATVFQSEEIETDEFTVAGLTWPSDVAQAPGGVEVRVREEDGWTGWQALTLNDEGPDAGTAEHAGASAVSATDPLVSTGADAVQVRLGLPAGQLPDGVEVVTIDPGSSLADTTLSQSTTLTAADAASARPAIISRAAWGADESLRTCTPGVAPTLKAATLHHTAGSNDYSEAATASVVRGIYAYHTRALGWCDIGYNFLVDKYGRIYEGRSGGVDRPVVGAHAGGFNSGTVGVSAIGNYSTAAAPAVMVSAIGSLVGWKLALHRVDPVGSTVLTSAGGGTSRYSAGTAVTLPTVFGHRDVGQTECPGKNLYAQLAAVRSRARVAAADAGFVRAVYLDMLSRTPADAEVSHWVPYAAAPGGRAFVAGGFAASEEYRKKAIRTAYTDILGRPADAGGLEGWYRAMASGSVGVDGMRRVLLSSNEFRVQAGGTDAGWVSLLYTRALLRQASPAEVDHWARLVPVLGREGVISAVYDSQESSRVRVDRAYRAWLDRTAGTGERIHWEAVVATWGDEAMRQAIMVSEEYYQLAQRR